MKKTVAQKFSCIDLFAGCGGLSLGLRESGWRGMFAIERDPMAFETFSRNFLIEGAPYPSFSTWPAWLPKINHDITTLLSIPRMRERFREMRGSITLMAGGPPCQGFSVGGRRDGADERNNLVFHMLDMINLVQPRFILIENVEGIARKFLSRPGEENSSIADAVIDRLGDLGYEAAFHILDASRFGVPQARRRVVILGVRSCRLNRKELKEAFVVALNRAAAEVRQHWGLHPTMDVTAKDAIYDLHGGKRLPCPDSPKFFSSTYTKASSAYARALRRTCKVGSIPNSHRFSEHGERILALYGLAHATQPPGRLSKAFLMKNNTKKDKKVLIDPASQVSTITTHPDEFIHFIEPRNITVREMARLQSFPDDFHFYGRYTINGPRRKHDVARCSQVGNAVPPLMAQGLGLAVKRLLLATIDQTAPVRRGRKNLAASQPSVNAPVSLQPVLAE
jgi:DNA (cytosine-5)-methyltransferase 1